MSIHLYDKIRLKDGRTASIVEILEPGKVFLADVDLSEDWETTEIFVDQIETVIS